MNDLETGKDKIKKICEILKNETLEPAKQEAQKIIEAAQRQAQQIILDAEKKSAEHARHEKMKMEKERDLFQTSLTQAGKQTVALLKQEIEEHLFNEALSQFAQKASEESKVAAELISVLVNAIEREGISADFSAQISSKLSKEKVNAVIAADILKKLREKSVQLGEFAGGVQVQLHDQKLYLDLSDVALKELLSKYLRADFRKILFV